ncbi:MAG: AbrB/MazE/SpoVT family DNA-binding domain-containing protein [Sphingopyxis sp.]|nr:AbrB/MazE/SpoVT family DNA-binding domain-containing protein [Sphingopyxis sp.]
MSYHAKVIKGGKIVIPAEFRHALGFEEGDSLVVDREGDTIVLKSQASMLKDIRAKVKSRLKRPLTLDSYLEEKWAETDSE